MLKLYQRIDNSTKFFIPLEISFLIKYKTLILKFKEFQHFKDFKMEKQNLIMIIYMFIFLLIQLQKPMEKIFAKCFQFIIYSIQLKKLKKFLQIYYLNPINMESILYKLDQFEAKVHSLRRACKQNNLNINLLNGFNTKKMRDIYTRLLKHYDEQPEKGRTLWFESQLKLFIWLLISYSLLFQRKIQEFTQDDWNYFKEIFFRKDIYTFKYESKKLINQETKNTRVWSSEEDQILTTIMEDAQLKNRWNQVARRFYDMSRQQYFRTGKQCRQHWLNHLDPSKKHGKWNIQQDLIILKYVILNGKKWSTICKQLLPHRTQHMIKNRFKSLITKAQKNSYCQNADQNAIIKRLILKYGTSVQGTQNLQIYGKSAKLEKVHNKKDLLQSKKKQTVIIIKEEDPVNNYKVSEFNKIQTNKNNCQIQEQKNQIVHENNLNSAQLNQYYVVSAIPFGFVYQPTTIFIPMVNCWPQLHTNQ